jgi:hypothetical protein
MITFIAVLTWMNYSAIIIVSAISSFPRKRESRSSLVDSRFRGNDVDVWVAEFMIKANYRYQVAGTKAQSFFLFPLCLSASVPALSVAYTTVEVQKNSCSRGRGHPSRGRYSVIRVEGAASSAPCSDRSSHKCLWKQQVDNGAATHLTYPYFQRR